jgi:phosphoglycolate phosphatase-like HAD superfamily hydrolase
MPPACIVFDCDGVILESVPIKTRAFARLAAPFGAEAEEKLLMFHREHGGVSRFKKFAWLYTEVLGREISRRELEDLDRRFARITFEELLICPLVPGFEETARAWHGRAPLYVCSGAPHEELNAILGARGLARYFTEICGSPPAKAALLSGIVQRAGVNPARAVMVGDSMTDLRAAREVGTLFYGRGEELKGEEVPWGEDLADLDAWLNRL